MGAGYAVSYGYDAKGRMNNVSWNVNNVPGSTTYSYLPSSDLLSGMSTVRTDGAYTPVSADYVYEPHRDVKTQVLNCAGARTISQYDYRYNEFGNRTSVVNTGEAFGSQHPASSPENREGFNLYSYNSRSEVTESKKYSGTDVDNPVDVVTPEYRSYAYDPIGNRTQAVEGNETQADCKTTTYTSNGLNQYDSSNQTSCESAPNATQFTYDADGNMTSVSDATGYTIYVFDGENRLIEVRPAAPTSGQKRVTMAYGFMGRRIKKDVYIYTIDAGTGTGAWTLDTSRTFTWDGWLMTDEIATASAPNAQPEITSYVWGLDLSQTLTGAGGVGGLIAAINNSSTYYFSYNSNGNVGQLVNGVDGSIAAAYEYDSYGNLTLSDGMESEKNFIKWSTKYSDVEIGLVYFGYRLYSFEYGKWISRDIIAEEGGINLYGFVNNNTINTIDYLGKLSIGQELSIIRKYAAELLKNYSRNLNSRRFAIGIQAGANAYLGLVGIEYGYNLMFFPESCQVALYKYINGMWSNKVKSEAFRKWKGQLEQAAQAIPIALSIGVGIDGVRAIPMGTGAHNAKSWLGWFYTASGNHGVYGFSAFTSIPVIGGDGAYWTGGSGGFG